MNDWKFKEDLTDEQVKGIIAAEPRLRHDGGNDNYTFARLIVNSVYNWVLYDKNGLEFNIAGILEENPIDMELIKERLSDILEQLPAGTKLTLEKAKE